MPFAKIQLKRLRQKFDFHTNTNLPIHIVIFSRYTCNDHTKKVIDMSNPQSNLLNNIYATCLVNGKYSIDVNNYGCIGKLLKFNRHLHSARIYRIIFTTLLPLYRIHLSLELSKRLTKSTIFFTLTVDVLQYDINHNFFQNHLNPGSYPVM